MTADEYVPDEEQVRAWCRESTGDYPDVMDEWLDRFLARVRRDAKAEALREAADRVYDNAAGPHCLPCHRADADLLHTIATEYETGDQA